MINGQTKLLNQLTENDWSIYDGVRGATLSSSILLYLFIAFFVIVIGYEFSQHTYKSTLVSGASRLSFVLSKYVVMLIDILAAMVWYFAVTLVTGMLAGRTLGSTIGQLANFTGTSLFVITFFISVVFSLAIIVLIATKSLVIAAVFVVVWPVGLSIVRLVTAWHWLIYLDFFNAATGISLRTLSLNDAWRSVTVSLVLLIVSIVASSMIMRKQEL
ncbi:hypothetical protein FD19_GL000349 [Lacticaseibacillus thailandensis DSM 22698 = JCM 13996]|uniref:Uncharacterized protein n=2 Tax=Lacticaseibacillus thailandensis TaxID=381741 RepID=A0A0R2C8E0_9LACO|nr:hypothetical protein FD19_GL000349 [Lacticaseibacillus thailandensis DSM 22698 = JCM 13996]